MNENCHRSSLDESYLNEIYLFNFQLTYPIIFMTIHDNGLIMIMHISINGLNLLSENFSFLSKCKKKQQNNFSLFQNVYLL